MKTKAKYRFIEFIRPGCYWPHPYTLEQAFGVFRWMIETGQGYHDNGRWGRQTIECLLSCKPTCVHFSEVDPITSIGDLQRRFHYAILSDYVGPALQRWRADHGVTPGGVRTISFLHHAWHEAESSEAGFEKGIAALFAAQGRLGIQLNRYHSRAREICGVELHCRGEYRFVLKYGYQGSEWSHTLARQTPRMTFRATVARAVKELHRLIDGRGIEDAA